MNDPADAFVAANHVHLVAEKCAVVIDCTPEWQLISKDAQQRRNTAVEDWLHSHGVSFDVVPANQGVLCARNPKTLASESPYLTKQQRKLTETIPSEILANVAAGVWSAVQVLEAFAMRAAIAHHLTNPLTEVFFTDGLDRARELDLYLDRTGQVIGPLHGLPISIKDVFNIQGKLTTLGFAALASTAATTTETLIEKLHESGAVLYCKTNVPQFLMSGECNNFVYGRTVSAHNAMLSAGGSSGGEASLIAMGGSPLGIGTDIAGSIRTPANFNGIYGLCPSFGRLPKFSKGHASGAAPVMGVAGPLSRSIDGLEVYTRAVLDMQPWTWDPSCIRLPWDQAAYDRATVFMTHPGQDQQAGQLLCFGIVPDDSLITPHPPIQRGLRETKQVLRAQGHEIVDLPGFFDAGDQMWEILTRFFKADGGRHLQGLLSIYNEPLNTQETLRVHRDDELSATQLAELGQQIRELQEKYLDRWHGTKHKTTTGRPIDVLLMPSGASTACPNGTMDYWLYEAISNLLDWTCATIPVGFVDPNLDPSDMPLTNPLSEHDASNWSKYAPETYKDAPICLQVMGQRLTEETVLGALRSIDHALGRSSGYQAI